jgi:hypothetical protein
MRAATAIKSPEDAFDTSFDELSRMSLAKKSIDCTRFIYGATIIG